MGKVTHGAKPSDECFLRSTGFDIKVLITLHIVEVVSAIIGDELIESVPGGKVNIPGDHSMSHSKKKSLYEHVSYSERFQR
jgi:hypothetical protein